VAHRHVEVLLALERGGSEAAAEMKRHLAELQRALTRAAPAPAAALRDVFAAYRERPVALPAPARPIIAGTTGTPGTAGTPRKAGKPGKPALRAAAVPRRPPAPAGERGR
jgi:hypothetical protein